MLIYKLSIILLIHQQLFFCSIGWALRPTATTKPSSTPPLSPLVSSSEATLLTSSLLPTPYQLQQQYNKRKAAESDADRDTTPEDATDGDGGGTSAAAKSPSSAHFKNPKNKIVSVATNCTRDVFEMRIELNKNFRGLLYAKDFPLECRARGTQHSNVTLKLPTSGCGVRSESKADGSLEMSVKVMLQIDDKLRQSLDILKRVKCVLPTNALGMNVVNGTVKGIRNGRMRTVDDVPLSTPRVRIWLELGGPEGSGAVEVGQPTTLTVRAIVPGTMGVRIIDCAALDGLGESTQQLLDDRGCPVDEQVMPALNIRFRPAEEGWSKPHEDDFVEKLFTATFPAFKFPDRERLHVSCGVQLCKGKCPNVDCRKEDKLILPSDKNLARIEVFNSLAVTAPQIEVDRLRFDRRHNMTVEEYPPRVRSLQSEGTLCLSFSKLAISFCVLGMIFLIAIIVAICCLIRSRRRDPSIRVNRDSSTSMFSSSESAQSARFGSKLFIPYHPTSLPYGRVY
ncbi:uncharacterized protein LOC129944185 isoform X2 [Eupeodes corollae]|uniref:uncharacterized protein LOC129944185 isoform X2 n=1 Tax=Eupeodes corollae TaxID=290404 RepID=UPI0024923EAC|nr:uncharacterized protein LOC129944185 isoform X2 [Eupeodes corollae]